jgi:hypothetical protein
MRTGVSLAFRDAPTRVRLKIAPKIALDILLSSDILTSVENFVWNAGACSRLLFFGAAKQALPC